MQSDKNREDRNRERSDENRDPISGAPGAHPVGTGAGAVVGGAGGAAAAAAAGAATGTAVGGPIGTAVGMAAGAVIGGLAGKGIAEHVNPTEEDAYWREHHRNETYYNKNYSYEDYQGAYRTGYEGYGKWGASGKRYEEVEPELRKNYERDYGKSRLSWDNARHATRAAWQRLENNRARRDLSRYIDYDVVDQSDSKIGTLQCMWSDHTGEPAFLGVRTGWIFGKTHVVPAERVTVSEQNRVIRIPYSKEKVKDAPAYDTEGEMDEAREWEIYRYYGISGQAAPQRHEGTPTRAASEKPRMPSQRPVGEANIPLSEEELKIGKREVEAGGVRLRKVVRTETVNQPVELKREEIVIERVPANETQGRAGRAFEGEELYIPLRREEAVVEKRTHVREEVRVKKETRTDKQQVSESVRREDVEIEEQGEARRAGGSRTPAEEIRERERMPRSQRRRE